MQKGFSAILVIIGFTVAILIGGGLFYIGRLTASKTPPQEVAQTPRPIPMDSTNQPSVSSKRTNQTDEITNWKKFSNNVYQFSYPKEWYLKDSNGTQFFYLNQEDAAAGAQSYIMIVTSYDKQLLTGQYKVSFADPVGTKKETADKVFTTKTKDLTISNHSAFEAKSEVLAGSQTDVRSGIGVYIDMDQQVLNISLTFQNSPGFDTKIFDQILSTFKFTQ